MEKNFSSFSNVVDRWWSVQHYFGNTTEFNAKGNNSDLFRQKESRVNRQLDKYCHCRACNSILVTPQSSTQKEKTPVYSDTRRVEFNHQLHKYCYYQELLKV